MFGKPCRQGASHHGEGFKLLPPFSPCLPHHKLFTSLPGSHELLISNLASPSNMFSYSTAILVHLLDTQDASVPSPVALLAPTALSQVSQRGWAPLSDSAGGVGRVCLKL